MSTEAAVHLNEILQVALTVNDMGRAKEFYSGVLGMQFLFDAGSMAFFQCGTVRVLIGSGETSRAAPLFTSACRICRRRMRLWLREASSLRRSRT